ncbi:MAG: Na+/proline symporter/signal transduction histidine kinase [Candidatus Midichloriaceae bacterium]|jgi:Na+/proline symporter/signal transduction histidine kinase
MGKLHVIDVSIVGIYLLLCLVIGLYKSTKIKSIKDYAIGSGNLPTFVIVSTIFATFINARATIGDVEAIHSSGLLYGLALFFVPFNWLLVKNIYAKNIGQFKGCISMSEIMGKLYGNYGRHISNFILISTSIGFISVSVTAIGYLFNYFFAFEYVTGVFIGMGIVTLYSLFGGVRAVAMTDVFQFLVFFIALPIACGIAYFNANGYENIIKSLPQTHLEIFGNSDSTILFASYAFLVVMPAVSAPYIQRLLMASGKKQLMNSFNILMVLSFFFAFIVFVLGFSIKTIFPNIEGKLALYTFIGTLSPVFLGIMVAGMLAVIMSTADSWLDSLSVIVSHDVIKKICPGMNERQELFIARIATCVCAGLAVLISLESKEIFKLIILIEAFFYTTILLPFTMGFFKFRTNYISFLIGVLVGIIFTYLAKLSAGEFSITSLVAGVLGNAIGFFSAHYLQVKMGIIKIEKPSYKVYKATLSQRIKQSIEKFVSIKKRVESSKSLYYIFALFIMALNIPILILGYNISGDFVNVVVHYSRYIAVFFALLLIFHEMYYAKNPNILWNTTLFLVLPFFSTYLFITSGYGMMWGVNWFVSIIALFLFANLYYAWILGVSGVLAAIIAHVGYNLSIDATIILYKQELFAIYSTVLLSVIVVYIIYHKFREEKIKQKTLEILGRSIAHDVMSPLSVNLMSMELIEQSLKDKDYKNIEKHIKKLKECNKQAMQDVDVMLSSTRDSTKPKDWGQYSIIKSVGDALDKYFMNEEQRGRVFFLDKDNQKKDFTFVGSNTLLRHVIFNLLKNAIKYAGYEAKIEIFIKDNKLHVKDNGCGMDEEVLANLFQKYTTTGGNGIGLNFCKQAMLKMGGNIECKSIRGEGTEFIISFVVS